MSKVEDLVAWRLMWWVYRQLKTISQAGGYNYSPSVTMDYNEFTAAQTRAAILFEMNTHAPSETVVGGTELSSPGVQMDAEFTINANVLLRDGEPPRKAALALEQDVRNCLHGKVKDMRAALGRGFTFRYGSCQHDAGMLTPEKEAGFRLYITYRYSHGSDW